jgi:hypothetical protein
MGAARGNADDAAGVVDLEHDEEDGAGDVGELLQRVTVVMEMVATYCGRFYATKPELAAGRIEAIGFQVGHQLYQR